MSPLPSYLQAHLDETYAASTLIFPKVKKNSNARDGNVFYQVTAYRHMSGSDPTLGFAHHDKENVDPCAPLLKKSRPNVKKAKALQPRSRPLPLRKRPLMEEDDNVCTKECCCVGCKNTISNSGPQGIRTKTITEILHRRPDAFEKREKKVDEGCRCKKNKCLKKYCVCYNVGVECDPRKCRCINCQNRPGWEEDVDEEEEEIGGEEEVDIQPPSFVEIPSKASRLLASVNDATESPVSASSSGESSNNQVEHFIVSDKRLRHSKRFVLRTNKPQDQDSPKSSAEQNNNSRGYLLGLGTPSPFGDIHEV
ncbi:hypothetical protein HJC23_000838 [Cyclotella cryptica]|uniref:CRC domain-containing protein n=1 Tax=Cyclotella cryptica TaxID=29204 RepID=A0ABD3P0Y9_9STRA